MNIYKSIADLIGKTPLLELSNYNSSNDLKATIIAKLESFNPAGSVKDRIAKAMIEDAEAKGLLKMFVGILNDVGRAKLQYVEYNEPTKTVEIREVRG